MPDIKKQDVREISDVDLDDFLHQLNNQLAAILSNIHIAKLDSKSDSEQYTILVEAEAAAIEATELIKQFYDPNHASPGNSFGENKSTEVEISDRPRILVVDDDHRAGTAMSKMLKHLGYGSEFAKDLAAAIEIYSTSDRGFDLVFLDLLIPGGKGPADTLKEIRQLAPKIKTILVSGHLNDPIMTNYKKFGFDDAISKPYRLNELESALNKVFSKSAPR